MRRSCGPADRSACGRFADVDAGKLPSWDPSTMTVSIRRAARAAGLTDADQRAAESALGRSHQLTKAVANRHTLALQSSIAALPAAVALIGLLVHAPHATLVLSVGAVTCGAFVVAWAVTGRVARQRADDLIADGNACAVIPIVEHEERRLGSRVERERLARSLEAFHQDAVRWHEILPQFRPPHGVAQLRNATTELEALTEALRRDRVRVRASRWSRASCRTASRLRSRRTSSAPFARS
jgi:hypothetical protein